LKKVPMTFSTPFNHVLTGRRGFKRLSRDQQTLGARGPPCGASSYRAPSRSHRDKKSTESCVDTRPCTGWQLQIGLRTWRATRRFW
jgi:hypothetical protein